MKQISFTFIFVLLFSTCAKLDENPEGKLTSETLFNSAVDVETVIMGTYGLIASKQLYGQDLTLLLLLRGDMCTIGDVEDNSDEDQLDKFTLDGSHTTVANIWAQAYKVIATANAAIHGVSLVETQSSRLTELEAEARFVRAFMYYHLVRLFGNIPYVDFFIEDESFDQQISQLSPSDVYTHILEDLNFAKGNLPEMQESEEEDNTRTRATIGTARAFLASVHLTMGNHQKALEEAKWVIDNSGTFGYELVDFQDLFNYKKGPGLEEHLLAFDFKGDENGDDGVNEDYLSTLTGIKDTDDHADGEGESVAVPSLEVYLSWDERDGRFEASMEVEAEFEVDDDDVDLGYEDFDIKRPHIAKYARTDLIGDTDDGAITDNNYAAMRYAEVLLIAAEAANELGMAGDATGYINEIRERARDDSDADLPADLADGLPTNMLRDSILEERRLELAFEFKRWYDIKRLQLGGQVFGADGLEQQSFNASRDYLLPLPGNELLLNPTLKQNTGY